MFKTLVFSALLLGTAGTVAFASDAPSEGLYADLGGQAGIQKFTHDFLVIVLADDRIKDKFADANIERLEGLLAEQFCDLSGGPCHYSGKDMKTAHKGRNITMAQFNALAEDLQISMERDGVSSQASNRLIAKLAPMFGQVVTK